ncbi:hypothetical protein FGG08_004605 [Glutinoglossum americanum]|uniref:Mannosyl phosphorylinositol ceramide synthase SUR1 n=1 Tax=Glutinoglossum americanum TaxID=1670608 RepID=A0A9P8L3S3_9PEZI|nr:hypothetical protein FGG08_004605 [Glutinoglossum americanum]
MRKRKPRTTLLLLLLLLAAAAAILLLLLLALRFSGIATLASLLFEDGSRDLVRRGELERLRRDGAEARIPRVIHQTFASEEVGGRWGSAQATCLELHRGWEYMLWTDAKARYFIEKEYNWFLETYDSYPYMIQRADVIRYFVLAHYGGFYIDLDEGCMLPLDPLLPLPAFLRLTTPTGISNDIMGSAPSHPFFLHVIRSLQAYARNWYVPYITVMYTTGPLFLSVMWKEYMMRGDLREDLRGGGELRVLGVVEGTLGEGKWGFWMHAQGGGSSWHLGDARMGDHWILVTILGILLTAIFLHSFYRIYIRLFFYMPARNYRKTVARSPDLGWLSPQQFKLMNIFSSLWSSSKSYERLEERVE